MLEQADKKALGRPKEPWYRALRPGDGLLVLAVLLLAALLFSLNFILARKGASSALLIADGEVIRQWDSQALQEGGEEALEVNGYHFVLEWEEGRIRFAQADCPDQVCVNSGWLGGNRKLAACLPAGLILKLSDPDPQDSDVDLVVP